VLASLAIAAGCSDGPTTAAPTQPNASVTTSATPTAYNVTVGAPIVLEGFAGSTYNLVTGVNTLGDVAGISMLGGTQHGARWPAGSTTPSDVGVGNPHDINAAGQLAGERGPRATLWTPDGAGGYTITNIGQQLPAALTSSATALNANGQVVGTYHVAVSDGVWADKCFLWTPDKPNATTGTVTLLPDLGGSFCIANDINSAGYVVGVSTDANNEQHAFLWTPPTSNRLGRIRDLTPGNGPSYATSINDARQVAGQHNTATAANAAIWTPTPLGAYVMTDLGTFTGTESWATDINDAGFVVGFARHGGLPDSDAFFWQNGEFTLLPGTGSISEAAALTPLDGSSVQVVGVSSEAGTTARTVLRWNVTLATGGSTSK
jgi:probable HAF family extracellular repeat protein